MARVLVVDDDPVTRRVVDAALKKRGHRVVAVASGPEALETVAERGAPDIAVLDVSMPGMDGHALLRALRGLEGLAELPIIFLSAGLEPADVEAGRALGARYLTKPFVATALLNAIQASLPDDDGW